MYNISFVITTFNTKKSDIENLVNSFEDSFSKFEFVFIDDCSTNKEAINYVKTHLEHNNVKVFELDKNTRRYGAFIKGLKESNGKYIHSLDADDMVKISSLLKLNKLLNNIEDDALVFPNYIKKNKFKFKRNPWAFFDKKTLKKHKWNYRWPNFAAYNIAVKKTLIDTIEFPTGIKGPHDDAYFGQTYIRYAKNIRFINICWFVYRIMPGQNFSGARAVANNFVQHDNLLMESLKLIDPNNPLTYIPFHSLLISHIRGMSLIKTEIEVKDWFNDLWEKNLKEKIHSFSYWKKLYFYKKTKNDLDNIKKLL